MQIDDYQNWTGRLLDQQWAQVHSIIGVPLKYEDETIGVINLLHLRKGVSFSKSDNLILTLLSLQVELPTIIQR